MADKPLDGIIRPLKNDAGSAFSDAALTATDNSETINPKGYNTIGLVCNLGTVSGTSPTLDIKAQCSVDGGTTWIDAYPDADNAESTSTNTTNQAIVAQKTSSVDFVKFWPQWFPSIGGFDSSSDPRVRFVFTVGGTNPSYTFTSLHLVLKDMPV